MDERMERLRAIAATRSWRSDASVRLSDLCALLETYDALVAALEMAKDRLDPFDEEEATMHQIDAALALARGGR